MKDDRLYLIHIQECINRIEKYTADGKQVYLMDDQIKDAVMRNLQVLSESTQRLSDGLKEKYPRVDWRSIAAFRNVAVHNYLGVDYEQIWDILKNDIPALKKEITTILGKMD